MDKKAVVAALEEFGTLLDLDGANTFKVRAFENGARSLDGADIDLKKAVEEKTLGEIKGIGAALQQIITELVTTGRCAELDELRAKIPAGLVAMTQIPGFGPKKAHTVWTELQIDSVDKLEAAAREGKLAGLRGFGGKTVAKILEGIGYLRTNIGRFHVNDAYDAATAIVDALREVKAIRHLEPAGSLRRWKETVHDLDFVAATDDAPAVMQAFVSMDLVGEVLAHGDTKSSVRLASGLQVDLRTVTPAQFPHALQHFTGSKEHNIAIRSRAKAMGLKVNEYGLFREEDDDDATSLACKDEAAIYKRLGLAYIPPELREDMGEIDAAERGELPALVEADDMRGILHCHSTWSDGKNTLREMAEATRALGMEYYGCCDHSKAAAYANGLTPDRVRRQWDEIDALNAEYASKKINFRILKGIEADILPSGELDYHDDGDLLGGFELVVGSVHSSFGLSREDQTARVLRAMDNPALTILGHATGRLLLRREGFQIDLEAVLAKAAELGIVVETNANPWRLDIDWRWGRKMNELGVRTSINPDAHEVAGLHDVRYGLGIARKGWFTRDAVVNCWSARRLLALAAARRGITATFKRLTEDTGEFSAVTAVSPSEEPTPPPSPSPVAGSEGAPPPHRRTAKGK